MNASGIGIDKSFMRKKWTRAGRLCGDPLHHIPFNAALLTGIDQPVVMTGIGTAWEHNERAVGQ